MSIKKFAILGERCSGTNFLEESILNNFNIEYTAEHGNKHFFCYNNYDKNTTRDTLFIAIIRDPIYWLNSFSKELYHIPSVNKPLRNFLFNEFYSVFDEQQNKKSMLDFNIFSNNNTTEIVNPKDLNYLTGNKYKNIFEMRKLKNHYLMNIMPHKVKNYILINYESLLYNYDTTLNNIQSKFDLVKKNETYVKIKNYKKSDTYNFVQQRQITLTPFVIDIIWKNLDINQELSLGYNNKLNETNENKL
jgi:DNA-binding Lrp family transcriptional regulator